MLYRFADYYPPEWLPNRQDCRRALLVRAATDLLLGWDE